MSPEKPVIEKTIEGIIPVVKDTEYVKRVLSLNDLLKLFHSSSEFSYDCSVVWHTSGKYFFIATKGHGLSFNFQTVPVKLTIV